MDWMRIGSSEPALPNDTSTSAGNRLPVIDEDKAGMTAQPGLALTSDQAIPPTPVKSHYRNTSTGSPTSKTTQSYTSSETLPPEYAKYNYNPGPGPEGAEKAERLYENHLIAKRGGWGRLIIVLVVLACVAIGLGVGLGVGLNHHKKLAQHSSSSSSSGTTLDTALGFPLGEYSLNTALRDIQTNCTSNAATWRCFPYSLYSNDSSSASASEAVFNWILTNTSASYISNATLPTTSSSGVPANISLSSSDNPFSISITNTSLTYYNNNDRPRFGFNLTTSKQVIPNVALTTDNAASTCFYNNTMLVGLLYLSDGLSVTYPTSSDATTLDSYQAWPYAVRVEQIADGGTDVSACYETVDGSVGNEITGVFTTESETDQCVCHYANFDL
ncbi:hypothetical protein BDV97DRAFT_355509 [Delphinella strobiligena]|nr:hypothetical protein BDV97DRAFT_355509 [Delphinella strobiligena]